ncbi:hypothetical protein [Psychromonas ossibalaenae]|uniref:hypothetical protein n=1 Tax=Psychromonas ossibalaenae TaxID=444922 RepID=UPI000372BFF5|nr:hypothetical protein [Psychromonas ossibalaenae]
MAHIPVNFLDKLKFETAKFNNPQYFFQFWQFSGEIDDVLLQSALKLSYASIPKLNTKLTFTQGDYHYIEQSFANNFVTFNTSGELSCELQKILEKDLFSIVHSSCAAPFILLKIQDTTQERFLICLMINHIYCDAGSAYLFMECLTGFYNALCSEQGKPSPTVEKPVDDADFVADGLSRLTGAEKIMFADACVEQAESGAHFFSQANEVKKIYSESAGNEVLYDYFHLPLSALNKPQNCSLNSVVSALITGTFLELKGDKTGQAASISVSANVRAKGCRLFGNYVTAIPIQLRSSHQDSLLTQFQQQMSSFKKNPTALLASYHRLAALFKQIKAQDIMAGFRAMSLKYHFYISNYGAYNPLHNDELSFSNCRLETAGGFNFPLQAHYGLIFTLVPFNKSIGISIACSPSVFSKKEMQQFKSLMLEKLK